MRVVLYILLAVNAAYLYLNVDHWRTREPDTPVTASHVKQLVLLSEADAAELRARRSAPPLDAVSPAGVTDADARGSEPADGEPSTAGEGETLDTASPLVKVALSCYSVGPLADAAEQAAVAAWLTEQGAHAELREDERRELTRYWVHLAPLESVDAAKAQLADLRNSGIDDLHVIRRGNMANAISLGLYRRKEHLDRRVAKLQGVGIEPQVQERYTTYKSSWFDVVAPADSPINDDQLAERFPAVEVRSRACGATSS